jgi:3-hydroxyisobutyrate dehydrogenase-like beta-hydroxyacid dehydrogenase
VDSLDASIGLVGLGVMGSAISALLLRSGAQVWGCDLAETRREQLLAAGGQIAGS